MGVVGSLEEFGRGDVALAGGKGANLGALVRAGFPVPPGFVVTTEAYRADHAGGTLGEPVRAAVLAAYADLGRPPVAVRSSATAEDLEGASFAGQQDTYLNVRGDDALLDAVRRCWASLFTERAVAYRAERGVADAAMAVVVQEMVEADAAGVMFTANPANGRRHETVVSAAWGLGEAVVGGLVDTDEVVVRLPEGTVVSRRTADKRVMTAYAAEGTVEREVPDDRRRAPVLDDPSVVELARLGARVQECFGAPQDVEWVRRDQTFLLVQARPITVLPPPEADPPTDWSVPDPHAFYARASIVEQLPDPLTPLFADLVRTSVSRSLQALFRELVGDGVVGEDDVDLPTVNGYAYYRYSVAGMARLMLHSGGAFRMLLTRGQGGTEHRWRTYAHPRYVAAVQAASAEATAEEGGDLPAAALLDRVRTLLDAGTEYYTAVQTIIPLAAFSETFLTWFYDRFVKVPGGPPAATFLLGFDSVPIRAEKSLWDLATWTRGQPGLAETVLTTPVETLLDAGDEGPTDLAEWRRRFAAHLAAYGHLVYDLDFANPVPAEEPGPLVDAVRFFVRGEGSDPYLRQQGLADRREHAGIAALSGVGPLRGWAFRRLLAWAQANAPLREDALADVGLAWPLMRRLLHELSRRLLEAEDLVLWLREAEVRTLAAGGDVPDLAAEVERRQEVWRGQRRVTPPQLLPQRPRLDRLMGRFLPAVSEQTGDVLDGLAGSAGRVTARARVVSGPADFSSFEPGEVLVAAITTPAWTSLFPRAAAVVTDIGGPLSHSSIVAREYGIPAVLGTGSATRRIRTGDLVTVDGDAGRVELAPAQD
ncbi:PEP/pyruvate-binding domain-containing protein [Microlunatus flavus]|uniref:Pyruvate, water dikinase n=1 Tax=Microlunatus flavus TaxID=1036181 RepID=A0A1H9N9D2_9ACTN|nr:PEP/pyruvate-binding domain-containing protein [Microlunatus flavus]SER32522.1 pyruvate, water dikinase [Microlunatus flavus]